MSLADLRSGCGKQLFVDSQVSGGEAAEEDVCGEWFGVGVFAAGANGDFGGGAQRVAVDAGADAGEGDACAVVLLRQFQRAAVAGGE